MAECEWDVSVLTEQVAELKAIAEAHSTAEQQLSAQVCVGMGVGVHALIIMIIFRVARLPGCKTQQYYIKSTERPTQGCCRAVHA
jgi:hypothetical protein